MGKRTRKRSASIRVAFLLLALGALLPLGRARAIEVELTNGKTFKAERMTFDGKEFTFYSPAKLKIAIDQVKYCTADISPLSALEQEAGESDKRASQHSSEIEALRKELEAEKESAAEKQAENETLRARIEMKDAAMAEANAGDLQREKREIETNYKKAQAQISALRGEIETLKQTMQRRREAEQRSSRFEIESAEFERSKIEGLVDIRGRIRNPGPLAYATVVLDISILDKAGKLLGVTSTFVTQFSAGATRSYAADAEADFEKIGKIEVVAAAWEPLAASPPPTPASEKTPPR